MAELFDVARFPFWKDVLPLAVVVAVVGALAIAWHYRHNRGF